MTHLLLNGWSKLQELNLSSNYLHAGSIECVANCAWPCLTSVSLEENEIGVDAIDILIQGSWPCLEHLYLGSNPMCEAACQSLARGAWPQLASLGLRMCGLDLDCFHQLLHGCWPDLEGLDVEENLDLTASDVYDLGQDIVTGKVLEYSYAQLFVIWLKMYDNEVEWATTSGTPSSTQLLLKPYG